MKTLTLHRTVASVAPRIREHMRKDHRSPDLARRPSAAISEQAETMSGTGPTNRLGSQFNRTYVGVEVRQSEKANQNVADLHTLTAFLTGSHQIAGDVTSHATVPAEDANTSFFTWMHLRKRTLPIAKAAVRQELANRRAERRTRKELLAPS
jgi:hypothetical protein